jgi:hypothetical protein
MAKQTTYLVTASKIIYYEVPVIADSGDEALQVVRSMSNYAIKQFRKDSSFEFHGVDLLPN